MEWQTIWQDLRYGLRMLRKSPGFTIVAVLTLALGIGATTVIFSIVNAVLFHPLPYPNSGQLVLVWETDLNRHLIRGTAPPADFFDWRTQNHVFQDLAAVQNSLFNLSGSTEPQQVWGARVSANLLELLGIRLQLGRPFSPEEEQPGHDHEVILSHGLWVDQFGANRDIIGQSVKINDESYTVVGVLPAGVSLYGTGPRIAVWVPLSFLPSEIRRDNPSLMVFGRMKEGISLSEANAEMQAIGNRLAAAYPDTNEGTGVRVASLHAELTHSMGKPLLTLLAAVGLVLLIACANVANLLLSRGAGRQREVAVRSALGARRLRLVRQLLTESVTLGLIGAAAGIFLAVAGFAVLRSILPPAGSYGEIPHEAWIGFNLPVFLFALVIAIFSGAIFGLAPAFQFSKTELSESLKESGRSSTGGQQASLTRHLLVISEVGLSLVLLISAGTLLRGFRALMTANPGFNPQHLLTMQVWLPASHYATPASQRSFFQQVLDRTRSLPGAESVSAINFLPYSGWTDQSNFDIEGRIPPPGRQFVAHYRVIDSSYFQTMQLPMSQGRNFTDADGDQSLRVAIINEALAHAYWPDSNPVGNRIRLHLTESKDISWRAAANDSWTTIVGVVNNVIDRKFGDHPIDEIYLPYLQDPSPVMRLVVRTAGAPLALAPAIRHAVESMDEDQPVSAVDSMQGLIDDTFSPQKLSTTLLSFFASLALLLAAIGIYGVISYSVQQRTHEIGIRMALGAQPRDVVRLVVWQGLRSALLGVAVGIVGANAVNRLLGGYFYGLRALDPMAAAAAVVLLLLVSFLASYIPARRATSVDPVNALRYE